MGARFVGCARVPNRRVSPGVGVNRRRRCRSRSYSRSVRRDATRKVSRRRPQNISVQPVTVVGLLGGGVTSAPGSLNVRFRSNVFCSVSY